MAQRVTIGRRPAFKLGERFLAPDRPSDLPLPKPKVKQLERIQRPGLKLAPPKQRTFLAKREFEAERVKREGIKVAFGERTLQEILGDEISVPAPPNPDGTPQLDSAGNPLMVKRRANLEDLRASTVEKLVIIENMISRGAESQEDGKRQIIALILSIRDLESLSAGVLSSVRKTLDRIGVERDPVASGIKDIPGGRLVNNEFWRAPGNSNVLVTYLLGTLKDVSDQLTPERPVFGIQGAPILLSTLRNALGRGNILNLVTHTMHRTLTDAFEALPPDVAAQEMKEALEAPIPLVLEEEPAEEEKGPTPPPSPPGSPPVGALGVEEFVQPF